jgi:hypothetical protein
MTMIYFTLPLDPLIGVSGLRSGIVRPQPI